MQNLEVDKYIIVVRQILCNQNEMNIKREDYLSKFEYYVSAEDDKSMKGA